MQTHQGSLSVHVATQCHALLHTCGVKRSCNDYLLLLDAQYVIVEPGTGLLTLGFQAFQVHVVPFLPVQGLDLDIHIFQAVLELLLQLAAVLVTGLPDCLKFLQRLLSFGPHLIPCTV